MTPEQIAHNQRQRKEKGKTPEKVKIQKCRYCKKPLVRLRTITRCYEVIQVKDNSVTWVDANGKTRTDAILTLDHIMPRSKGGGRGSNLVPACAECNQKKADQVGVRLGDVIVVQEKDDSLGGIWITNQNVF